MKLNPTMRALGLLALVSLLSTGAISAATAQEPAGARASPSSSRAPQRPVSSAQLVRGARAAAPVTVQGRLGLAPIWPGTYPIYVLPAKQGFFQLQPALDFCALTPAIPAIVLLAPGTYTGNFTLPPEGNTTIVGREGRAATVIEGQVGVVQPVLAFTPAAAATFPQVSLHGLHVRGTQAAVLDFVGSGSRALLLLEDCLVEADVGLDGIRMSGGGLDDQNRLALELRSSLLRSLGGGIAASIGSFVRISCARTDLEAAGRTVDVQASVGSQATELVLYDGSGTGQSALVASHLDFLWCGGMFLSGQQSAVAISDVPDAKIERSELHCLSGDAVRVSGTQLRLDYMQVSTDAADSSVFGVRAMSSSSAQIAYCSFNAFGASAASNNAIDVDGSSSATSIFNHWRYVPLP